MLTQQEKQEITKEIVATMESVQVRTDNKFEIIQLKLEQILEQTTKHNHRMSKAEEKIEELEKNDLIHVANCPIAKQVRDLEKSDITSKGVKKYVSRSVAMTGSIIAALWILVQIIEKYI